jgi:hypothetical protein
VAPSVKDLGSVIETNFATVDRQFLLFQLEFVDEAKQSLQVSGQQVRNLKSIKDTLRLIDPMDYDDPSSEIYFRNILNPGYDGKFKKFFDEYKTKLFDAVSGGSLRLRQQAPGQPFINITELVQDIEGYDVSLDGLENKIAFTINNPSLLANRGIVTDEQSKNTLDLFNSLNPSENDILVIRTSYGGGNYETEFVGLLSNPKTKRSYGRLDRFTVDVFGLSKLFYTTQTIKQQALNQQQFIGGVAINNPEQVSVYSDQFNGKTTKQIFDFLLTQTLALRALNPGELQSAGIGPNTIPYKMDEQFFQAVSTIGFQNSVFVLLTLKLMLDAQVAVGAPGSLQARLFPQDVAGKPPKIVESPYRAILEHGEHKTFNEMVATGFENFFSQLTYPHEIIDEVRGATYYDAFEAREGVIILRPPRYNRIELTDSEFKSRTMQTDFTSVLSEKRDSSGTVSGYQFNRNADFFIKNEELLGDISFEKNDMLLDTMAVAKFMWPFVGEQDFPAGSYVDPNLLIKYGTRSKGPVSNPSVQSPALGRLFAPIILSMHNAGTRGFVLPVKDGRRFRVGKLYYIEAAGCVAYLSAAGIIYGYQKLSAQNLTFTMARKVEDRIIKDIASANEIQNFALCYLNNPTLTGSSPKASRDAKKDVIAAGKQFLAGLGPGFTMPMFRYLPTILDLILDVEETPGLSKQNRQVQQQPLTEMTARRKSSMAGAIEQDGVCFATGRGTEGVDPSIFENQVKFFQNLPSDPAALANTTAPIGSTSWLLATPPAPVFPYGQVISTQFSKKVINATEVVLGDFTKATTYENVKAVSTPVLTKFISQNPNNFDFSGTLVNKLAALDLAMKFRSLPNYEAGSARAVWNPAGFPQLYAFGTTLFNAGQPAQGYLDDLFNLDRNTGFNALNSPITFYKDIFSFPNSIKLNTLQGVFDNTYFTLPQVPGFPSRYRLPFGHLIFRQQEGAGFRTIAIRVGNPDGIHAGTYDIALDGSDSRFKITGVGTSTLQPEDGTSAPVQELSIFTFDGLYLISPFTDVTVERMIQAPYDTSLVGFRTNAQTNVVLQKATEDLRKSENDAHVKGLAYDLCPDFLVASSEANLAIKKTSTTSGPLYSRLEGFISTFFNQSMPDSVTGKLPIQRIGGAITVTPKDEAGVAIGPSFQALIYHLSILSQEVDRYRAALLPDAEP